MNLFSTNEANNNFVSQRLQIFLKICSPKLGVLTYIKMIFSRLFLKMEHLNGLKIRITLTYHVRLFFFLDFFYHLLLGTFTYFLIGVSFHRSYFDPTHSEILKMKKFSQTAIHPLFHLTYD